MANGINIDTAGLGGLLSGIGTAAKGIREAITGKAILDPAVQAALEEKLAEIDAQSMSAQAAIDQAEAASPKLFISGWRPMVGWICAMALAWDFILRPLLAWIFSAAIPALDMSSLMGLLMGMLGLGTMRSVEKVKGAEGNR